MAKITASLVVSFSEPSASSGSIKLEVDGRSAEDGGLNNGKTSFVPGDPVYYLLYLPQGATLLQHIITAGGRTSVGYGNYSVEEILQFTNTKEATLSYPANASAVTKTWLGLVPGVASMKDQYTVVIPSEGIGLLKVTYTSQYQAFRLSGVPATIDQVLIWVQAEV